MKRILSLCISMVLSFAVVSAFFTPGALAVPIEENKEYAREMLSEGTVLLKNENKALPLKSTDTIALFGGGQIYTSGITEGFIVGGGGSTVLTPAYTPMGPAQALLQAEENREINIYHPLYEKYAEDISYIPDDTMLTNAAAAANKAVMVISRYSKEGTDNLAEKGEWYLSDDEEQLLKNLTAYFETVIVLVNSGNIIDTSWAVGDVAGIDVDALVMVWLGGAEAANGIADVILGRTNPSGKLSDTIAKNITDYPSTAGFTNTDYQEYKEDIFVGYRYFETFNIPVNYEFGFGLSYTTFDYEITGFNYDANNINVDVKVTNTGSVAGKEVVQVYFEAPQMGTGSAVLSKSSRELAAFAKTNSLAPGVSQTVNLSFPIKDMATFDDTGLTGHKSAYVLEAGTYNIYAGNSVKNITKAGSYTAAELRVTEQLSQKVAPTQLAERLLADGTYESLADNITLSSINTGNITENQAVLSSDEEIEEILFREVIDGKHTMDEFVGQMTPQELVSFTTGYKNAVSGGTGTIGPNDVTCDKYGIVRGESADGTSGLRLNSKSTGYNSQMLTGCTWNTELAGKFGTDLGKEAVLNNINIWLAPGLNIHRNPLCGRNFEYYSEDPLLTGKMASAVVKAVQAQGVSVVLKHFAANNKETNRNANDSRVSERALRQIYLEAFRIAIQEGGALGVMTSYNLINGTEAAENKELITGILYGEWDFKGLNVTDWGGWGADSDIVKDINAGTSVKMPNGDTSLVQSAYDSGDISRATLETNAKRILTVLAEVTDVPEVPVPSDSILDITGVSASFNNTLSTVTVKSGVTGIELVSGIAVSRGVKVTISNEGVLKNDDTVTVTIPDVSVKVYKIIVQDIEDSVVSYVSGDDNTLVRYGTTIKNVSWSATTSSGAAVFTPGYFIDAVMESAMKIDVPKEVGVFVGSLGWSQLSGANKTYLPTINDTAYNYGILEYYVNFAADDMITFFGTNYPKLNSTSENISTIFGVGTADSVGYAGIYHKVTPNEPHKVVIQYSNNAEVSTFVKMWVDDKLAGVFDNEDALYTMKSYFHLINKNSDVKTMYLDEIKVTATNFEYVPEVKSEITVSDFMLKDGKISGIISNTTDRNVIYKLIAAAYDENGGLADYKIYNISANAGETGKSISETITVNGVKVKAFILENFSTLCPICPAAE